MRTVYRIENEEGIGPYIGGFACDYDDYWLYDLKRHPSPDWNLIEDTLKVKRKYNVYFGFKTLRQLKAWFHPKVLNVIKKKGYKVVKYKCSNKNVVDILKQVAFLRGKGINSFRVK